MNYLKQIRFQKEDHSSFLVPKLEKKLRKKEYELKSCYISYFSLRFIEFLSSCIQDTDYSVILLITSQYLFSIFSCLLCGFLIDIISIKSSWHYFITANILVQLLQLLSAIFNNAQMSLFAMMSSEFLGSTCIIIFSCIQYEAAANFKVQLNTVVKLEVYGEYFPYIIYLFLFIIINEYANEDQAKKIKKDILIYQIIVCQLLNLISLVILNKTYKQIEKIKSKSIQYQRFLIYQGVGLSISKIFKYFKNKNVYFLLIMSALVGCLEDSSSSISDQVFTSDIQTLVVNVLGLIFGLSIMKFINSKQKLVQSCYKASSYCLYSYLISTVFLFVIKIISQETNLIPKELCLILESLLLIIKESLFFILYCLTHQMIIMLLPNRCCMKAIGLSITFLPYFFFRLFCILSVGNLIYMRLCQIIVIVITIIINYIYQKNICFNIIEQQLEKQYQINNR